MPKYFNFKICGYYLYFTSHCILEAMHVHASDSELREKGSAKFFVKGNGETTVENQGRLTDKECLIIRKYIKLHYKEMYEVWSRRATTGFYEK